MPAKILFQFDPDQQASSFDSVVAIDAGVDHLLTYPGVQVTMVRDLVHGGMFTRGGDDLRSTAVFVGGNNVEESERIFSAVQAAFFGPIRVSVMLDANGCNTTASAAVVAAGRHVTLAGCRAMVLGGTGPVGRRVAQLLAAEGADVLLTSRSLERAESACVAIRDRIGSDAGKLTGAAPRHDRDLAELAGDVQCLIASGAAGVELINAQTLAGLPKLAVAIDLNAVPPAGIEGIEMTDKAKPLPHGVAYGAIGVGGLKMKTHKAAIAKLFTSNDQVLDAKEIYRIAKHVEDKA